MSLEKDNLTWRSTSPNIEKFGRFPFYVRTNSRTISDLDMELDGRFLRKESQPSTTMVVAQSKNEAVLTIVGVLKSFDLPPVKKNSCTDSIRQGQRRSSWLQLKLFAAAMDNMQDLAYELSTRFTADSISHWVAAPDSDVYGPSLSSSCSISEIVWHTVSERRGVSLREKGKVVLINKRLMCITRNRYATKEPSGFRAGDIMEMGFELVAFRQAIRGEEDKHIYGSFAKAAFHAQAAAQLATSENLVGKKRMEFDDLSSDEEDYPDARKCMAMLRLVEGDREGEEAMKLDTRVRSGDAWSETLIPDVVETKKGRWPKVDMKVDNKRKRSGPATCRQDLLREYAPSRKIPTLRIRSIFGEARLSALTASETIPCHVALGKPIGISKS
ncbi:hypothetical protein B0H17DRAFT_1145215 [Mycena rosella]|uniref:Uncharacterized protein n=1 Tax=Mycena rosella TaxID=1033263 RepID=A0AAD7CRH1_MYCRO|nr:hypothetical protein B0H17DRAFT_1145215 [Mycena rosella]